MKKTIVYLIVGAFLMSSAYAALGDLVGSVNFDTPCGSTVGVGIAFDGTHLWYSCGLGEGNDLFRADPVTGVVDRSYNIADGLGALSYDAGRNAIWAGWDDSSGTVRLISLDDAKEVIGSVVAFSAPEAVHYSLCDGLAYDGSDDTLYISGDVDSEFHHYSTTGAHLGAISKAGSSCGNSGLALGGDFMYEGFDGCNEVIVVDKADFSTPVLSFSTAQGDDPGFRDEDLECDTSTFAGQGKHVMWSVEAYEPRRALAFEIEFGTCGEGGEAGYCGDGILIAGEECDDGNNDDGDGCSSDCLVESDDSFCGDGNLDSGEECDYGDDNTNSGLGDWGPDQGDGDNTFCATDCTLYVAAGTWCGDGNLQDAFEECDDGNEVNGDGCTTECEIEGETPGGEIPEFTTIGAGLMLLGAGLYAYRKRN